MRVWVDISNSPQVAFFRPLIALLQARGHEVEVTTREYAQTLELLQLHGIEHTVVGPGHGGARVFRKGLAMASRMSGLRRFVRRRGFDLAVSHASHELPLVARSLGLPSAYTFDYELALVQHGLGCRAATRVVVPEVVPQSRLDRLGARERKVRRYPGLKEEYYLAGFRPDPGVLDELALDRERILVAVRTPPEVSLYHRHGNPLFVEVLERLGRDPGVHAVVLPRTEEQRAAIAGLGLPSLVVPGRALDALSLVALSDLVISAGGTMNREAAALGVPVYTTFAARMGAVDEALVREGRVKALGSAAELEVAKRAPNSAARAGRDPSLLLDLLLSTLES